MLNRTIFLFIVGFFVTHCTSPDKKATQVPTTTKAVDEVVMKDRPVILFFGKSITAGYQLDPADAFPALIQKKLDSLGFNYLSVNAGLSGETTAGGLNRIDWVLKTVPSIFVLELGANDGLRGLDLNETKKNLIAIIEKVRKANPEVKILLTGMRVPPNLGVDYTSQFVNLFSNIAESTKVNFLPFILEGVAGDPDLNLEDGIHPTPKGHRILAENVWSHLEPMLDPNQSL
jgi:acyl-CoA thioesterase-1